MNVCKHIRGDGICVLHSEPFYKEPCSEGPCNDYEPLTNADRIRTMTDKELAEYHAEKCGCPHDPVVFGCRMATIGCIGCWLDWLKQKVERSEDA